MGLPVNEREDIKKFLGVWGLVSFEHVLPSGETSKPFGDSPLGLLIYQSDGYMSAQVSAANHTSFANNDPDEASAEEAAEAWRTYFGYWGSFKICAEQGIVLHRVEGSSFPNWIATEQVRYFRFAGANRLVLETESSGGHFTLTWQKRSS